MITGIRSTLDSRINNNPIRDALYVYGIGAQATQGGAIEPITQSNSIDAGDAFLNLAGENSDGSAYSDPRVAVVSRRPDGSTRLSVYA